MRKKGKKQISSNLLNNILGNIKNHFINIINLSFEDIFEHISIEDIFINVYHKKYIYIILYISFAV